MQENTTPFKLNIFSVIIIFLFLGLISLLFYTYNKKINLIEKKEETPITIDKARTSDQQKLLKTAKEMYTNESLSDKDRETAKVFYYRNTSDLTPVGQSEERKKNFIEGYISLYDIYKNGKDERNKARAALSLSHLYLESCSIDDWLIEATKLFDNNLLISLSKDIKNDKAIAHAILSSVSSEANDKYYDKALVVVIAENNVRLAELKKLSKEDYKNVLVSSTKEIENVKNSTSTLISSTFDLLSTDRKILTILLSAESKGIKTGINIEKEYRRQLDNTKQGEPASGAYVNEYNLRYLYASYLWNKGGGLNIDKIKKELDVTFTEEKIKNAPGWIYGISVSEKSPLYSFLKPMSKEYPELASFLKKHGWKNV